MEPGNNEGFDIMLQARNYVTKVRNARIVEEMLIGKFIIEYACQDNPMMMGVKIKRSASDDC